MSLWWTKSLLRKKLDTVEDRFKSLDTVDNTNPSNLKIEIKDEPPSAPAFDDDQGTSAKEEDSNYRIFLSTQRICRLCESRAHIPLFEKVNGFDVLSAIRTVTNITVKPDDWYPKFVCSICLEELHAAFTFKRKCQLTDMKYRQLAGIEDSFPPTNLIRHDFTLLLHKMSVGVKIFKRKNGAKEIPLTKLPKGTVFQEMKHKELELSPPIFPPQIPPILQPETTTLLQPQTPPMVPLRTPSRSPSPMLSVRKSTVTKPVKRKKRPKERKKECRKTSKIERAHKKERANRIERGNKKERFKKKKLMCIKCDAEFQDEDKYTEHREQSACKRTQCPQCEKQVLNLRIHTRRMHPRGPVFQCDHCDRAYPIMSELQRHMLVHTNSYDFPCSLCSYRGKRKEYLKLHMRSHGSERYLCSECPATFINQSNFNKHRLVHANKQYQCEKCKKAFRYAKQLQVHDEAQHQKIRHPCSSCGQIFKYRSKLLKHELRVHNREKRKLNPPSATTVIRLETNEQTSTRAPEHANTLSVDSQPVDSYVNFKKDQQGEATFYTRNFEHR